MRPWSLLTVINLFRTGADRQNGIIISLLVLVAETIKILIQDLSNSANYKIKFSIISYYDG